jgi:hypothetical protein
MAKSATAAERGLSRVLSRGIESSLKDRGGAEIHHPWAADFQK